MSKGLAEVMAQRMHEIDRMEPPGEISEAQFPPCPLCHYKPKRKDAETRLSASVEEELPAVLERTPARTHWILRAMLAHLEKCPLFRVGEELN